MTRLTIIILLTLTSFTVKGQLVPYGLRLDKVQKEILEATTEFDSLIFADKASYWAEDVKIQGFGFISDKVFKVIIFFEKDTSDFYDITIKKLKKTAIKNKEKITILSKIDYSVIRSFDKDSLTIMGKPGEPHLSISDGNEWTILLIDQHKKSVILQQSYLPETYQQYIATTDRQIFIDISKKLNELITK